MIMETVGNKLKKKNILKLLIYNRSNGKYLEILIEILNLWNKIVEELLNDNENIIFIEW